MIGLINWKRSSRRFVKQPCLLARKGRPAQSSKLAEVYSLHAWSLYSDLVFMKVWVRVCRLTWGLNFVSIVVKNKEARGCPASYLVGTVEKDNSERCHTPFHTRFKSVKSPAFHFTASVRAILLPVSGLCTSVYCVFTADTESKATSIHSMKELQTDEQQASNKFMAKL